LLRVALLEKLISKLSFHETLDHRSSSIALDPTFLAEPTRYVWLQHVSSPHRHLGPDCSSARGLADLPRAGAQYCMLARSSGHADNCRRHETRGRVRSNL